MSNFFKESDCDSTGYYSANDVERISGIRTAGPTISLDKANALIKERGTAVYGSGDSNPESKFIWGEQRDPEDDTHQALLIKVEPIEKDSAEKLLNDLANYPVYGMHLTELIDRAKALREGK